MMTKTTTSLSLAVALLFVACNGGQDAEITAPSAIEAVLPSAKPSGMPASVATLTLGWPAEEPPLTDRLAVEAFVHEETYAPYTRERIDAFYAAKESLEENKHFVALNGKETLAQVFTDCRYTKSDNEAMSSGLLKALARQGFLPTPCTE